MHRPSAPDLTALCPSGEPFAMHRQNTSFPLGCINSADHELSFKSQNWDKWPGCPLKKSKRTLSPYLLEDMVGLLRPPP